MKKLWVAAFLFLLSAGAIFSQEFDKARLDSYFDALEKCGRFMGSVALSQNGELIYTRSLGTADVEKNLKADVNSRYRIGSISKTFTAVLVMKAVEKGMVSLDQTIDKYFPSIPNAGKITVRYLLYHRSGIHSFTEDKDYTSWCTEPKTREELLEIIAKGESEFEPDSKAAYSNSNYVLLSMIVEKIYGKPYDTLLKKQITKPFGLKYTSLGGKIDTGKNECRSYSFDDGWKLEPETDISVPLGTGGVVSTPSDLVRFSNALFGGKLVSKKSLEQMKTWKDKFGIGMFPIPFYEHTGYGHTGGIDGFSSVFCYFDDRNLSYALTSNGTNYNNNNISIAILSAVYGKSFDIPDFKTFEVAPEILDQYTGVYASEQIPVKITVTRDKNRLIAQGTGQSSFPLEAVAKDKFKFEQAGVVMEFNPEEKTMILKQGGGMFSFRKE